MADLNIWREAIMRLSARTADRAEQQHIESFFKTVYLLTDSFKLRFLCSTNEAYASFFTYSQCFYHEVKSMLGKPSLGMSIELLSKGEYRHLVQTGLIPDPLFLETVASVALSLDRNLAIGGVIINPSLHSRLNQADFRNKLYEQMAATGPARLSDANDKEVGSLSADTLATILERELPKDGSFVRHNSLSFLERFLKTDAEQVRAKVAANQRAMSRFRTTDNVSSLVEDYVVSLFGEQQVDRSVVHSAAQKLIESVLNAPRTNAAPKQEPASPQFAQTSQQVQRAQPQQQLQYPQASAINPAQASSFASIEPNKPAKLEIQSSTIQAAQCPKSEFKPIELASASYGYEQDFAYDSGVSFGKDLVAVASYASEVKEPVADAAQEQFEQIDPVAVTVIEPNSSLFLKNTTQAVSESVEYQAAPVETVEVVKTKSAKSEKDAELEEECQQLVSLFSCIFTGAIAGNEEEIEAFNADMQELFDQYGEERIHKVWYQVKDLVDPSLINPEEAELFEIVRKFMEKHKKVIPDHPMLVAMETLKKNRKLLRRYVGLDAISQVAVPDPVDTVEEPLESKECLVAQSASMPTAVVEPTSSLSAQDASAQFAYAHEIHLAATSEPVIEPILATPNEEVTIVIGSEQEDAKQVAKITAAQEAEAVIIPAELSYESIVNPKERAVFATRLEDLDPKKESDAQALLNKKLEADLLVSSEPMYLQHRQFGILEFYIDEDSDVKEERGPEVAIEEMLNISVPLELMKQDLDLSASDAELLERYPLAIKYFTLLDEDIEPSSGEKLALADFKKSIGTDEYRQYCIAREAVDSETTRFDVFEDVDFNDYYAYLYASSEYELAVDVEHMIAMMWGDAVCDDCEPQYNAAQQDQNPEQNFEPRLDNRSDYDDRGQDASFEPREFENNNDARRIEVRGCNNEQQFDNRNQGYNNCAQEENNVYPWEGESNERSFDNQAQANQGPNNGGYNNECSNNAPVNHHCNYANNQAYEKREFNGSNNGRAFNNQGNNNCAQDNNNFEPRELENQNIKRRANNQAQAIQGFKLRRVRMLGSKPIKNSFLEEYQYLSETGRVIVTDNFVYINADMDEAAASKKLNAHVQVQEGDYNDEAQAMGNDCNLPPLHAGAMSNIDSSHAVNQQFANNGGTFTQPTEVLGGVQFVGGSQVQANQHEDPQETEIVTADGNPNFKARNHRFTESVPALAMFKAGYQPVFTLEEELEMKREMAQHSNRVEEYRYSVAFSEVPQYIKDTQEDYDRDNVTYREIEDAAMLAVKRENQAFAAELAKEVQAKMDHAQDAQLVQAGPVQVVVQESAKANEQHTTEAQIKLQQLANSLEQKPEQVPATVQVQEQAPVVVAQEQPAQMVQATEYVRAPMANAAQIPATQVQEVAPVQHGATPAPVQNVQQPMQQQIASMQPQAQQAPQVRESVQQSRYVQDARVDQRRSNYAPTWDEPQQNLDTENLPPEITDFIPLPEEIEAYEQQVLMQQQQQQQPRDAYRENRAYDNAPQMQANNYMAQPNQRIVNAMPPMQQRQMPQVPQDLFEQMPAQMQQHLQQQMPKHYEQPLPPMLGRAPVYEQGSQVGAYQDEVGYNPVQEAAACAAANSRVLVQKDFCFARFVPGEENRELFDAAKSIAKKPCQRLYNPLFIHGPAGVGKTHLISSIANELIAKNISVVYTTAEEFIHRFVDMTSNSRKGLLPQQAAQNPNQAQEVGRSVSAPATRSTSIYFKNLYLNAQVLIVDNIEALCKANSSSNTFCNILDTFLDQPNRQVVLASRLPLEALRNIGLNQNIYTRLHSGMMFEMQFPSDISCSEILRSRLLECNLNVEPALIGYMAERVNNSPSFIEGLVKKLFNVSRSRRCAVDMTVIQEAFDSQKADTAGKATVGRIQDLVAQEFNISVKDLCSKQRTKEVSLARSLAMYIIRKHIPKLPLTEIALAFNKDHSSTHEAIKRIENMLQSPKECNPKTGISMRDYYNKVLKNLR